MALQQIYWEQIATENVVSGSNITLGNPSSSLGSVYADNLVIGGTNISESLYVKFSLEGLNSFTGSVSNSLEFTGSNLTVKGGLNVLGTFTSVKSETVILDDNIIELNGSEEKYCGLLIKDPTSPNLVSGSLLWDTTNDRWIGGQLGSEENLVVESELTTLSSSLSSSINELSQSVSSSFNENSEFISDLSSSISSSINELSQSVSSSFNENSEFISDLSSSISSSITELSQSVSSSFNENSEFITDLSSSISTSISELSSSVSTSFDDTNTTITNLSSSLSASINDLSSSVDGTFIATEGRLGKLETTSGSHHGRLNELESTGSDHETRIDGLELFSSSLDDTYATDQELDDVSSSLSDAIEQAQIDIGASNIFQQTGSYYGTAENLQISGSGLDSPDGSITGKYGVRVHKSLHAENINVGQPTSNEWGTMNGSYFNNFNENTDVSEIIRFMAGLLSSSAPDASPNTKYYNGYTKNTFNTSTDSGINGYLPSGTTNTTLLELVDAGFASIGGTILGSFGTFYTNSNYSHSFTSRYGGSTSVRSSNDGNLFGLGRLSSGTPTTFKVSGSFTFKKFDHNRVLLEESSSNHLITQSGAGTTNGVTLGRIESANPELIPAGYQDGKYSNVFNPTILNAGNTIDDIGYYHISSSISIASGSSDFTTPIESNTEILYGPMPTIESGIGSTNLGVSANIDSMEQLTATSRSLSGAPYLQTATFNASGSIGGTFNKLYQNGTHGSMSGNSGQRSASVSNGRISTNGVFYDETFTDVRTNGTIPHINDKIKLNSGLSWSAGNSYGTSANQ